MEVKRLVLALVGFVTVTLGLMSAAGPVLGAHGCVSSWATGDDSTEWFNVFGIGFDPSVPATLTFDTQVIPYSIEEPHDQLPPTTSFTLPADYMTDYFKWTFESVTRRDAIAMTITGKGCTTSTTITFDPTAPYTPEPTLPDTATNTPSDSARPTSDELPIIPALLMLAFAGGLAVSPRLFRYA